MDCEEVGRELAAFYYGELDLAEMERMLAHLRECEKCQAEFEETRRTLKRLGEEPAVTLSDSFYARWETRQRRLEPESQAPVGSRRSARRWWAAGVRVPIPVLALLCLSLAAVPVLLAWSMGPQERTVPAAITLQEPSTPPAGTPTPARVGPPGPWNLKAHPRAYELIMAMRRDFHGERAPYQEKGEEL